MTRQEHLLVIAAEECAEVAHRIAKILRFGINDVEPGQELTNKEQLSLELDHIMAMARMLSDESLIFRHHDETAVRGKIVAVEKWLLHAKQQGTLTV